MQVSKGRRTRKTQARKPSLRIIECEELSRDLLGFREKALELGASAAEVIPASCVVVQERVWMKCLVPRCEAAGRTPYCPPNTPQPDFMRKVFDQYQWAVVFKSDVGSVEDYTALSETAHKEAKTRLQQLKSFHAKTWQIVGRLESYVQSKGYDLAMGFSAGSCNGNLCGGTPCAVLQNENCRHPLRARPSMEAVGIDVFDLAAKLGWNAYMIRAIEPNPNDIPCAMSVGIVFIY